MHVMIAESTSPKDFYIGGLEGESVAALLNTMGIKTTLRYALDFEHLKKAIAECTDKRFRILHLVCHGDKTVSHSATTIN